MNVREPGVGEAGAREADASPALDDAATPGPTAILAEDEPLLADELADLLKVLWPELRIVTRAGDGVAALNAIDRFLPDVALLDIHMPLLSGIEVARRIAGRCHVAFITSYDQHALEAFEAGAIDYVLKPPTAARLLTTVERLKTRLQQPPADLRRALKSIDQVQAAPRRYLQWINASRGSTVQLITVEEIVYFRSDQKYTLVVTPDGGGADQEDDQGTDRRARPDHVLAGPSFDGGQRACDPQRHTRRSRQPHAAAQAAPRNLAG